LPPVDSRANGASFAALVGKSEQLIKRSALRPIYASLRSKKEAGADVLRVDSPVVVLNTFHTGLAIARDLGRLGVRVLGLTAHRKAYGNASRWMDYRHSPDSLTQPRELLACLLELSAELNQRPILLPTRDHDINFLINNWESLSGKFILPMLPPDRMSQVLNKDFVAIAARESDQRSKSVTWREPRTAVRRGFCSFASASQFMRRNGGSPVYGMRWAGRKCAVSIPSGTETFYSSFSLGSACQRAGVG
jgi:hypothetical protein